MKTKVSDYIVDFLIEKGITDVFGYPGGMVTHLMESFRQKEQIIKAHVNYHEQAAAFAACGYAQVSGKPGVAYATSGPGATNLITGICNAYFDSVPVIFLTGQVNTFERKKTLKVRQKGFQETDVCQMVRTVTKYCCCIEEASAIKRELEKAWYFANEGRKGPVLLDIPMDVFHSMIDTDKLIGYELPTDKCGKFPVDDVVTQIQCAKRPVVLAGAGMKNEKCQELLHEFVLKCEIPVVTSMPAFHILENSNPYNYGFIGAYGSRVANFIVAKSDLLLAIGTRLDVRQIGADKKLFAPNAKLIRVDIDEGEFTNQIKQDEFQIVCDAEKFLEELVKREIEKDNEDWLRVCNEIKCRLNHKDDKEPNEIIRMVSREVPESAIIVTDVGQNQVWVAQSFEVKKGQKVLFSSGHGAMGYSLPASIGAYYASGKKIISFNGDGGFQMNMQELQFIVREKLPIMIVILNNRALGMIRHFQEMYFNNQYYQTVQAGGYDVPDFSKISMAYGIEYARITDKKEITQINWNSDEPMIVEIFLEENTYVFPKLEFGKPNQDQEPLLDRTLYASLMEL